MPTYDYHCDACGHDFEHFQSMSSSVLRKCPECKKLKLRRLIGSGAGLIFKGSGFYITDYRSDSYAKDKGSDSAPKDAPAKEASKESGKGGDATSGAKDSKPAPDKKDGGSSKGSSKGKKK